VDCINEHLRGLKKLDLFEFAHVYPKVPIEEGMKTLLELIKEGKFDHIGLSEARMETPQEGEFCKAQHVVLVIHAEVQVGTSRSGHRDRS
jgi:pyridoxine 4-dehydrogenase